MLDNHIHILLEVPPKPLVDLSEEELLERLASASRKVVVTETKMLLERLRAEGKKEEAEKLRDRIKARMWDVSGNVRNFSHISEAGCGKEKNTDGREAK